MTDKSFEVHYTDKDGYDHVSSWTSEPTFAAKDRDLLQTQGFTAWIEERAGKPVRRPQIRSEQESGE